MPNNVTEILKVKTAVQQSFTINTGVVEVDIPVGASVRLLEDVYGFNYLKRSDSILILGAGLMLPYQYCLSTVPVYMSMNWVNDAGVEASVAASFSLPAAGQEFSFAGGNSAGLFLPFPGIADPTWTGRARLSLGIVVGKVSMVNSPSALSGALNVVPWVRVQHNFPLEA